MSQRTDAGRKSLIFLNRQLVNALAFTHKFFYRVKKLVIFLLPCRRVWRCVVDPKYRICASRAPHTQADFASVVVHLHFLQHHTFCNKRTPIDWKPFWLESFRNSERASGILKFPTVWARRTPC